MEEVDSIIAVARTSFAGVDSFHHFYSTGEKEKQTVLCTRVIRIFHSISSMQYSQVLVKLFPHYDAQLKSSQLNGAQALLNRSSRFPQSWLPMSKKWLSMRTRPPKKILKPCERQATTRMQSLKLP